MTRARRTASLLLAAFYVLASAAMASAECAWVLWAETSSMHHDPVWAPVSASDTKQVCERALAKEITKARTDAHVKVTVTDTTVFVWNDSVAVASFHYICFPDTVDPRGPKGK